MSIPEIVEFDKDGNVERFPWLKKFYLSLIIISVASLSFGIGRLTGTGERGGIKIEYDPALTTNDLRPTTNNTAAVIKGQTLSIDSQGLTLGTQVVASVKGTKYHHLHCGGAKQIKEENKIVFESPSTAEAAGYALAANCRPR